MAFAMTMTGYGPLTNPVLSDRGGLLLLGLSGSSSSTPGPVAIFATTHWASSWWQAQDDLSANLKNDPQRFISATLLVDGHVHCAVQEAAFRRLRAHSCFPSCRFLLF